MPNRQLQSDEYLRDHFRDLVDEIADEHREADIKIMQESPLPVQDRTTFVREGHTDSVLVPETAVLSELSQAISHTLAASQNRNWTDNNMHKVALSSISSLAIEAAITCIHITERSQYIAELTPKEPQIPDNEGWLRA